MNPSTLRTEITAPRAAAHPKEMLVVALLALSAGLVFLDRLGIAFVFPQIRADLRLSNAQLGGIMSVTALTWAVSSIVFSFASDRLGGRAKTIILVCMIAFSAATGVIGLAAGFVTLIAARAFVGLFEGPMLPLIQSSVARLSAPHHVGRNLGLVIMGTSLFGNALPALIMTGLSDVFGWRGAFILLAVPGYALALAILLVMPPDSRTSKSPKDLPSLRDATALLTNRNVILGALGAAALIGFVIALSAFLPLFLNDQPGLSPGWRVALLTSFGIAGALGAVLAPWMSDRLPRKNCLLLATSCEAIAAALISQAPAMPWLFVPAIVAFLIGSGALTLMIYVIPGDSVPPRLTATTYALLIAFGEVVGGSTAPTVAGVLADAHGLHAAIWFSAALAGLGFIIALGLREPPRRDPVVASIQPEGIESSENSGGGAAA